MAKPNNSEHIPVDVGVCIIISKNDFRNKHYSNLHTTMILKEPYYLCVNTVSANIFKCRRNYYLCIYCNGSIKNKTNLTFDKINADYISSIQRMIKWIKNINIVCFDSELKIYI